MCTDSARSRMNSHIKINKKLRLSAFAASVFLFVFAGLAVFPVSNTPDNTFATGEKQSETVLTISADDLTLNFDIDSVDGSFAEDSASVSVVTNNITGYTLSINTGNTGDNAGKLVGENQSFNPISGATSVADFTDSADYNGLWGYKPSKINSATNTSYLPAPTETTTIEETNAPNAEANVYEIGLGARADLSYGADTFSNTFVITGVANPVGYTINYVKNTEDEVLNMPAAQIGDTTAETIVLADNTPTREGYDFVGWCDGVTSGESCNGALYQPGDEYEIDHTEVSDTTLKALWDNGIRTITFMGNGADGGSMEPQEFSSGETIILDQNQFTKIDYSFIGWNTEEDGTGIGYTDEASYSGSNSVILYAQWAQIHDITVNYHDGENTNTVVYSCYEGNVQTTRYSHTSNVSNEGVQSGGYGDNIATNEVVTIPGASSLHVVLTYQTEGVSWDWVSMWDGEHPDYTAANNYSSGIKTGNNTTGKYGGTTKETIEFDVQGNSITFGFRSDGSTSNYYGYYAVITSDASIVCLDTPKSGAYTAPTEVAGYNMGWSDTEDASSIQYPDEEAVKASLLLEVANVDKYVVYVERKAVLDIGESVNTKLKKLSGQSSYSSLNNKIKKIISASSLPEGFTPAESNTISTANSPYPVYAWYDNTSNNGIIYIYSPVQIYMNADSSMMLYWLNALDGIEALSNWDASSVTDMSGMFYNTSSLISIDAIANWDTSGVTDMSEMFCGASSLANISGVSNWDTSSVTDMSEMFEGTKIANIDALTTGQRTGKDYVSWDTSSVTDMSGMFFGVSSLTNINGATNWDTSSVTKMNNMFFSTRITNIDALATGQRTGKNYVSWDTSSVTDMSEMFDSVSSLTNINGATNWNTSSVTNMYGMFMSASSLTNIDGATNWNTSSVTNMYGMFMSASSLTNIDGATNWNTSSVTDMSCMFEGAPYLTNIDGATNWDTSSVTDMSGMFYNATSLIDIDSVTNWNTSSVTDMSEMFKYTGITDIDVLATGVRLGNNYISWDTSSVTDMSGMFYGAFSLANIDGATNWDTSSVTDMSEMFYNATSLVDIDGATNWDTSKVTNMFGMFSFTGINDIDALATGQRTGKNYVSWDISSVTNMGSMFNGASSLANIDGAINWDTSNVISMYNMFTNASSLADINGATNWDTSNVTSMLSMFLDTKITNINALATGQRTGKDYVSWDVSNVTEMRYMFSSACSLTNIDGATNWNTSSVTDMSRMFYNATSLIDIDGATNWNTSSVTDMSDMFYNASSLADISGAVNWNTLNVNDMNEMFYNATSLTNIDALAPLNNWTVKTTLNKTDMFYGIPSNVLRPTWYE